MCQGLTNMDQSVKLLKITQNSQSVLKMLIFTVWNKSLYFFNISDRNWLILYKFHQNYPLQRIDQFPHLRILSLYTDQLFLLDC